MTPTRILLLTTVLAAPAAVAAQEPVLLAPIIVSAGLTPAETTAYGRAHTVLTREEIEARGAVTLQDALRGVPGVAVSGSGTSSTQIRIRGAEADHTLILVDGVDVSGGSPGDYFLSGLPVQNVERVEILRGPQSVFYGSNASAGVINIITDKGGPGLHHGGTLEVGNGRSATAHASQRTARGGLSLNLSDLKDDGYDYSGDGGDDDGVHTRSAALAGDWQATETLRFGTTLRWSDEDYEYDGFGPGSNEDNYIIDSDAEGTRREFQGAGWGTLSTLEGRLIHRLEYQQSTFKLRSTEGGDTTRTESGAVKYRLSYGLDGLAVEDTRHLLNVLAEHEEDESSQADTYRRERDSLALEYRASLDRGLDLQVGLRRDDNKVFDDFTSWTVGLSWAVPGQPLRLHASAGRAQVDPTYYELYVDDAFSAGNPNLMPEQNRSFDLGAELSLADGRGSIDVTYFNERLTNEILAPLSADGRYSYINADGESRREGVEISGEMQATERLSLRLGYTYLDAKDPEGVIEIRRPRHELLLGSTLSFQQGRGDVTATLRHVSGNYDDQFWTYDFVTGGYDRKELPAYTTVDLAAGYDLTDNVRLTGRIVNLFDEGHADTWAYAARDRTAYVGVQAKW